jgi:methionine biosynthesis protein MetW
MPVSKELPYQWYDTPNVHHCTLVDFEALCAKLGFRVLERVVLTGGQPVSALPNLFGALAVYRVSA